MRAGPPIQPPHIHRSLGSGRWAIVFVTITALYCGLVFVVCVRINCPFYSESKKLGITDTGTDHGADLARPTDVYLIKTCTNQHTPSNSE